MEGLEIRVVANRVQSAQFRNIRPGDIHAALGRDIAYKITDEEAVMRLAIDQGIPISEVKRRSAIGRDIEQLENGIAAALGLR